MEHRLQIVFLISRRDGLDDLLKLQQLSEYIHDYFENRIKPGASIRLLDVCMCWGAACGSLHPGGMWGRSVSECGSRTLPPVVPPFAPPPQEAERFSALQREIGSPSGEGAHWGT
jgi:hypothetical protein